MDEIKEIVGALAKKRMSFSVNESLGSDFRERRKRIGGEKPKRDSKDRERERDVKDWDGVFCFFILIFFI